MATSPSQSGCLVESPGEPHGAFELVAAPISIAGEYRPHIQHYWRDNAGDGRWRGPNALDNNRWAQLPSLIHSRMGYLEMVAITDTPREGRRLAHFWRNVFGWQAPTLISPPGEQVGAPAFIQGEHGNNGNFEVVAPTSRGFVHYWRDNDPLITARWQRVGTFGEDWTYVGASMIHSRSFGNLEVIGMPGSGRPVHFWQDGGGGPWSPPTILPGDISTRGGRAGFIQSSFGRTGNFEVVTAVDPPLAGQRAGLAHWWRDNDADGLPWRGPFRFGEGVYDDVSLIQSSYGPGNLEVIAYRGVDIHFYWRENAPPWTWHGPFRILRLPLDRPTPPPPPPPPPNTERVRFEFMLSRHDWSLYLTPRGGDIFVVVAPPGTDLSRAPRHAMSQVGADWKATIPASAGPPGRWTFQVHVGGLDAQRNEGQAWSPIYQWDWTVSSPAAYFGTDTGGSRTNLTAMSWWHYVLQ